MLRRCLALCASLAAARAAVLWEDTFDVDGPPAGWQHVLGDGCPDLCAWGNGEQQRYTDDAANVRVEGGRLKLTVRHDPTATPAYTSGRLQSTFSFRHGAVEFAAKMPAGCQGLMPVVWLAPIDTSKGWPVLGEIDFFEMRNDFTEVTSAIHFGEWPAQAFRQQSRELASGRAAAGLMTYRVEWTPYEIRSYADGELYSTQRAATWFSSYRGAPVEPFQDAMYMSIKFAVGGTDTPYTGGVAEDAACIAAQSPTLEVDYMRIFDLEGIDERTPVICGDYACDFSETDASCPTDCNEFNAPPPTPPQTQTPNTPTPATPAPPTLTPATGSPPTPLPSTPSPATIAPAPAPVLTALPASTAAPAVVTGVPTAVSRTTVPSTRVPVPVQIRPTPAPKTAVPRPPPSLMLNECETVCATCANATCSGAGQWCVDRDVAWGSRGDWVCECVAPAEGRPAVGRRAACVTHTLPKATRERLSKVNGAAAVGGAMSGTGAAGKLAVLQSAFTCHIDDIDLAGDEPLAFELHPFGVGIGPHTVQYLVGASVLNIAFVLAFVGVFLVTAGVIAVVYRTPLRRAVAVVHAPGVFFLPYLFVLQGTSLSAAHLVFFPTASGAYVALGCVALGVTGGSAYLIHVLILKKVAARARQVPDPRLGDAATALTDPSAPAVLENRVLRAVYGCAFGGSITVSNGGMFVEHWGVVFEQLKLSKAWVVSVELASILTVSLLANWKPATEAVCNLRNCILAASLFAVFVIMVWHRPFVAPMDNVAATTLSGLIFTSVALLAVAVGMEADHHSPLLAAAGECMFGASIVLNFKFVWDVGFYLVDIWLGRRAGARARARRDDRANPPSRGSPVSGLHDGCDLSKLLPPSEMKDVVEINGNSGEDARLCRPPHEPNGTPAFLDASLRGRDRNGESRGASATRQLSTTFGDMTEFLVGCGIDVTRELLAQDVDPKSSLTSGSSDPAQGPLSAPALKRTSLATPTLFTPVRSPCDTGLCRMDMLATSMNSANLDASVRSSSVLSRSGLVDATVDPARTQRRSVVPSSCDASPLRTPRKVASVMLPSTVHTIRAPSALTAHRRTASAMGPLCLDAVGEWGHASSPSLTPRMGALDGTLTSIPSPASRTCSRTLRSPLPQPLSPAEVGSPGPSRRRDTPPCGVASPRSVLGQSVGGVGAASSLIRRTPPSGVLDAISPETTCLLGSSPSAASPVAGAPPAARRLEPLGSGDDAGGPVPPAPASAGGGGFAAATHRVPRMLPVRGASPPLTLLSPGRARHNSHVASSGGEAAAGALLRLARTQSETDADRAAGGGGSGGGRVPWQKRRCLVSAEGRVASPSPADDARPLSRTRSRGSAGESDNTNDRESEGTGDEAHAGVLRGARRTRLARHGSANGNGAVSPTRRQPATTLVSPHLSSPAASPLAARLRSADSPPRGATRPPTLVASVGALDLSPTAASPLRGSPISPRVPSQ